MGNSQTAPSAPKAPEHGEDGTNAACAALASAPAALVAEERSPGATAASSSSSSSSVSSSSYASADDGGPFMDSYYATTETRTRTTAVPGDDFCFPRLVVPNLSLFQRRPNPLRVIHCNDGPENVMANYAAEDDDEEDDEEGYYHFDDAIRKRGKAAAAAGKDCCSPPAADYYYAAPSPSLASTRRIGRQFGGDTSAGDTIPNAADLAGGDSDLQESSSSTCIYNPSSLRGGRQRRPSASSSSSHSNNNYYYYNYNSTNNSQNDQEIPPPTPQRNMFERCYPTSGSGTKSWTNSLRPSSPSYSSFADCTSLGDGPADPECQYTPEELAMPDGDDPTDASNLQIPRPYWIVTTAALPWMTGTACNPLLRAAYLSQRNRRLLGERQREGGTSNCGTGTTTTSPPPPSLPLMEDCTVTLVLPWLESPEDRRQLYGASWAEPDKTPADQEAHIRDWLATAAHLPLEAEPPERGGIAFQWYPARYHAALSSIFALGDLCELIPPDSGRNTVCILEEPEHVNFYRAPGRESWRDRFPHVIGVVHTNYKAYARNHYSGILTGPLVGALSSLMVRAYCDRVVKLSPVLQEYAPGKEVVSNVHGIRHEFFCVPVPPSSSTAGSVQCYFVGKLLWGESS
jgi:hypothetical protein